MERRIINHRTRLIAKVKAGMKLSSFRVVVVAVRRFPLRYASRALKKVPLKLFFSYRETAISDYTFRKNYNRKKFEENKLLEKLRRDVSLVF